MNPRSPSRPLKPPIGCLKGGFPLAGWNLRSDGEALHDEPTWPMSTWFNSGRGDD